MPNPRLSRDALERARGWMTRHARPLDRALFRFRLDGGSAEDVTGALEAYRNEDGGFGHAIEPDLRLPMSSPIGTSVALQVLREVGADASHPLVAGAVTYLLEAWDDARRGWCGVPPQVSEHPHAPWWGRAANSDGSEFAWGNPDAELAGVLVEHASIVPEARRRAALEAAVSHLDTASAPMDPYIAQCYQRLALVAPTDARAAIEKRLLADARNILDLAPEARAANHVRTWWLAPSPDALLADALRPEIEVDLGVEIDRQHPDGFWAPRWSWGPGDPEGWAQAEHDWRGHETLRTVSALAAWACVDG